MDMDQFKHDVITGYREALAILFEMPFIEGTMTEEYLRKAVSEANTIEAMIFGEGIQTPTEPETKKDEKEEEEEEIPDEEPGIGGLFG